MKGTEFEKKYGIPHTRVFNNNPFVISAATKFGVSKSDAENNKEYLKSIGFNARIVKKGTAYYVYGCKK